MNQLTQNQDHKQVESLVANLASGKLKVSTKTPFSCLSCGKPARDKFFFCFDCYNNFVEDIKLYRGIRNDAIKRIKLLNVTIKQTEEKIKKYSALLRERS